MKTPILILFAFVPMNEAVAFEVTKWIAQQESNIILEYKIQETLVIN